MPTAERVAQEMREDLSFSLRATSADDALRGDRRRDAHVTTELDTLLKRISREDTREKLTLNESRFFSHVKETLSYTILYYGFLNYFFFFSINAKHKLLPH